MIQIQYLTHMRINVCVLQICHIVLVSIALHVIFLDIGTQILKSVRVVSKMHFSTQWWRVVLHVHFQLLFGMGTNVFPVLQDPTIINKMADVNYVLLGSPSTRLFEDVHVLQKHHFSTKEIHASIVNLHISGTVRPNHVMFVHSLISMINHWLNVHVQSMRHIKEIKYVWLVIDHSFGIHNNKTVNNAHQHLCMTLKVKNVCAQWVNHMNTTVDVLLVHNQIFGTQRPNNVNGAQIHLCIKRQVLDVYVLLPLLFYRMEHA